MVELKLNRMNLTPKEPSIYGRLRAEPKREYVSTLESVAAALTLCGRVSRAEGRDRPPFRPPGPARTSGAGPASLERGARAWVPSRFDTRRGPRFGPPPRSTQHP